MFSRLINRIFQIIIRGCSFLVGKLEVFGDVRVCLAIFWARYREDIETILVALFVFGVCLLLS